MKKADPKIDSLSDEVPEFERFLKVVGFKRIEGTIYGFLVLTDRPVTSEEICRSLGLSQGAVSQGLARLHHWNAVESRYDPGKRAQVHSAVEDSLSIVATIFQKREQEAIGAFKQVALRSIERCIERGDADDSARILRLRSIVLTCEVAEAVMNFVISAARIGSQKKYSKLFKALPRSFDLLLAGSNVARGAANRVRHRIAAVRSLNG